MKNLILCSLIILASMLFTAPAAKAQSNLLPFQSDQTVHIAGIDTLRNVDTVSQFLKAKGWADGITIQTGVAVLGRGAGTVKLYGSVDSIKFDYAAGVPDSLIITNSRAIQVKTWKFFPSPFLYYKIVYTGNAGQYSTISTTALIRNK